MVHGTVIEQDLKFIDFLRALAEDCNPLVALGMLSLSYVKEKGLGTSPEKTAILYPCSAGLFSYYLDLLLTLPHERLMEVLGGNRVHVFFKAKSGDLEKVLLDDEFQNIILNGDGDEYRWCATDKDVYFYELDSLGFNRKHGKVLKLTCSGIGPDEFALRIVSDPKNAIYFQGDVRFGEIKKYLMNRVYAQLVSTVKKSF